VVVEGLERRKSKGLRQKKGRIGSKKSTGDGKGDGGKRKIRVGQGESDRTRKGGWRQGGLGRRGGKKRA